MKKSRILKKALAMLLSVLIVFSAVSFLGTAAKGSERLLSDIEMYGKDHAHVYGNWKVIKASTCSSEGEKVRSCSVSGCDAKYTMSIAIAKNAHVYNEWKTTLEATCLTNGSMEATCIHCGYEETKAIKKLPHTVPEMRLDNGSLNPEWTISKEPVHGKGLVTQMGYARTKCAICGTTVTQDYYDVNNWHQVNGELSVIRESTCSTPGVGMKKCKICDDTITIDIPTEADAHVFSGQPIVTTPATCQAEGKGRNECTECHQVFDVTIPKDPDTHVDASGNIKDWVTTDEPYYHHDGLESVNCARCGAQSRKIYADHDLTDEDYTIRANPTCVTPGLMIAECSNCHSTIEKEIPVNDAHSWGEAEVLCLPTCVQEGIQVRRCARHYGHVLYETTEKTEHVFATDWTVDVAADCNTVGREHNECVECAQIIEREIPVIENAHTFKTGWQNEKAPTCTEPGTRTNYCYDCQKIITEEIPLHTETLVEISRKEPSCTFEGEIFYECQLCSVDVVEKIPLDPEAHNYMGEPAVYITPTCKDNGVGLTVCSYCKKECKIVLEKDPDTHVDADGNILEWETLKEVSGCKNGLMKVDCANCGTKTKTIYSTHGMAEALYKVFIYPTCENGGVYKSKYPCPDCEPCPGCTECDDCNPCKACGDYSKCDGYVYIPIEKGHNGILMSVVREATCTKDGLAFYKCSRGAGDHFYYEIIPATGHVAADEYTIISQPTCTTVGKKQLYCVNCEAEIQPPVEIDESHIYTSWVIDPENEGTCSNAGTRERGCQQCGYKEKTTYMLPHTPGEWKYSLGNCETGGVLERRCSTCSKLLGTKNSAADSHGDTTTVKLNATTQHCISSKVICNICNETVSQNIENHRTVVIDGGQGWAATCETAGMTDALLCMVCGYQTTQQPIAALGHDFQYNENGNKVCTKCGDYRVENQEGDAYIGCKCFCHDKGTIAKILYRICVVFWRLLDMNEKCDCGRVHWTAEA